VIVLSGMQNEHILFARELLYTRTSKKLTSYYYGKVLRQRIKVGYVDGDKYIGSVATVGITTRWRRENFMSREIGGGGILPCVAFTVYKFLAVCRTQIGPKSSEVSN